MGTAKLKKPLFYDGMFNRQGRSMRTVFVKEVSNGTDTFHLWQSAGQPDISYPRAENDAYVLYAEINEHLAPLQVTEYQLIENCGWLPAMEKLYGGKEQREDYFEEIRKCSQPGDGVIAKAIERETAEIQNFGSQLARQADYIKTSLDRHVAAYREAQKNGGETFPDFIGALILDDLSTCQTLSAVHKENRRLKETARRQKQREEEIALVEKKNAETEEKIAAAISILKQGGRLKNEQIAVYRLTEDSHTVSEYSIFNYLMRRYGIKVPLRTQGWINESLASAGIADGRCTTYQYRRSKRGKGPDTFCDCLNDLIAAVNSQAAA